MKWSNLEMVTQLQAKVLQWTFFIRHMWVWTSKYCKIYSDYSIYLQLCNKILLDMGAFGHVKEETFWFGSLFCDLCSNILETIFKGICHLSGLSPVSSPQKLPLWFWETRQWLICLHNKQKHSQCALRDSGSAGLLFRFHCAVCHSSAAVAGGIFVSTCNV